MKIKRIEKLVVNHITFKVVWDKEKGGGGFNFADEVLTIGTKYPSDILNTIHHELLEMIAADMYLRHGRGDCHDDYIFVYDHRQFNTMVNMFTGLMNQFLE